MSGLTAAGSFPIQRERVRGEKEDDVPYDEVMPKFKEGELHSGSDEGPKVKDRNQAVAIMLSEKRKAQKGKKEYQSRGLAHSFKEAAMAKRKEAK